MRNTIFIALVVLAALICLAQAPGTIGPGGNLKPCPRQPFLDQTIFHDIPPSPMQLIPAGEYEMGSHNDNLMWSIPVHKVYIDAFYMDTFEVTNKDYCKYLNSAYSQGSIVVGADGVVYQKYNLAPYCDTSACAPYGSWSRITWDGNIFGVTAGKVNHPMEYVTWYGAVAYANWRSEKEGLPLCYNLSTWTCILGLGGYRLPTEAEWEKAARGGEYNPYYRFPWGNTIDGSNSNHKNSGDPYETGSEPYTTPVGYYEGNQIPTGVDMANGHGLYDISGNVWEWCNDWFDNAYYSYSPYDNPKGPINGSLRVLRGGSWINYPDVTLGCADRNGGNPAYKSYIIGFRLVRPAF